MRLPGMFTIALAAILMLVMTACGPDPSFVDLESTTGEGETHEISDSGNLDGEKRPKNIDPVTGLPIDDEEEGEGEDDGGNEGGGSDGPRNFPNTDPDQTSALHRCLELWGQVPFGQTVSVHKISASVVVFGAGNAVYDAECTEAPRLVLIDAAVNVGGSPEYQLLNPNGYYCINTNVNVLTNLNIYLHANARLADSSVNVNVGSNTNTNTSEVGVHVGSEVTVHTVGSREDGCGS